MNKTFCIMRVYGHQFYVVEEGYLTRRAAKTALKMWKALNGSAKYYIAEVAR